MRYKYKFLQLLLMMIFLMLLISFEIKAQNYFISFAGVAPNATVTYDSVLVKNLSTGGSLMLYNGDLLQLGHLGINDSKHKDSDLKIYPNPCLDNSDLIFSTLESGNINLAIIDISGKIVLSLSRHLNKGIHRFKVSGLHQGFYLVTINGKDYNYTSKLVCQSLSENEGRIEYEGSNAFENNQNMNKTTNSTILLEFNDGDQMLYQAFSYNYRKIVTDIPTYSKIITFYFWQCTDVENNNYTTVDIGNQTWMAENLKTTRFRNGDTIANIIDNIAWNNLTSASYCDYNNISANSEVYGKIYNFYTVADTRKLCPVDWHLPNDTEWSVLIANLGGEYVAGKKLKETTITHWQSPNAGTTNESGFTALPGGDRGNGGAFYDNGNYGFWWSSTEDVSNKAWIRYMQSANSIVSRFSFGKNYGFSVRCLKD